MSEAKEYKPLEHSVVQALLKSDACNRYEVDRNGFVACLIHGIIDELNRVYWNVKQESLEDRKDWKFLEVPGFQYRRYFWGDCDCGFDELDVRWSEDNKHLPDCFSVRLKSAEKEFEAKHKWLSEPYISAVSKWAKENGWEHGWEGCAGYCDCGHDRSYSEWRETNGHSPDCSPGLPNMAFGDVRINWYKYPCRGTSCNVDWNEHEWRVWFDSVILALGRWQWDNEKSHHGQNRP